MGRSELERLSKEELIELVLRLQRPGKTSRTSSKPPSTDRKEQREQAKPGGAKSGHEGHRRTISQTPDEVVAHRPDRCTGCGGALDPDLPAERVSLSERIELPTVRADRHPTPATGGALPGVRSPRRGTGAGGRARHAVRPAAPCGGDVSQDVPSPFL